MPRLIRVAMLAALVVGTAKVVRRLQATRSPTRALDGSGPVIGSLDAWPPVPRAPQAPLRGEAPSPPQ